jgi:membrane-associated phospholipid phosphatase
MRERRSGRSSPADPRPWGAVRKIAVVAVVGGFALPLVRRRLGISPAAAIAGAAVAPAALCVAAERSPRRDVAACALQMWAYVAAYKLPHGSDPEALERRVRVDYPIVVDRTLGLGELPTVRLQRRLADPTVFRAHDKALIYTHWVWFAVPHVALTYILFRHPDRFPRAAVLTYGVFDTGALCYWLIPTAPPWYAAEQGRLGAGSADRGPVVRRMMVEYGEEFWRDAWGPLYSVLGGNPFAAMPSLHFATSVMAATLLAETGPLAGAVGTAYAAGIGFALVYLGEHYAADLLAGLGLTLVVRRLDRPLGRPIAAVGRAVGRLGERARAA